MNHSRMTLQEIWGRRLIDEGEGLSTRRIMGTAGDRRCRTSFLWLAHCTYVFYGLLEVDGGGILIRPLHLQGFGYLCPCLLFVVSLSLSPRLASRANQVCSLQSA
jgi:hypothetical protein